MTALSILSGLQARAGGVLGGLGGGRKNVYEEVLNVADFFSADVTNLKNGKWNKLGSKTVAPQRRRQWGSGSANQPENQGYIYVSLMTNDATPVQVDGKIRLCISDADELDIRPVISRRTEDLRGSTTDKTMKVPLPVSGPTAREDDKLIIQLDPDTDDVTVGNDESTLLLPSTLYK